MWAPGEVSLVEHECGSGRGAADNNVVGLCRCTIYFDSGPMTTERGIDAMLTVKDAAKKAGEYLVDLLPDARNLRLEEAESCDNDKNWAITLSFHGADDSFGFGGRNYKQIKVRKSDGYVVSMKIRDVR